MEKDITSVLEKRIGGGSLRACLKDASEWLEKQAAPDFFIEGVFLWEETEYGDWYINIYYTKGYYR